MAGPLVAHYPANSSYTRSGSQAKMKPWEAALLSETRRQVQDIYRSVQIFRVARTYSSGGDEIHEAGSHFLGHLSEMVKVSTRIEV